MEAKYRNTTGEKKEKKAKKIIC